MNSDTKNVSKFNQVTMKPGDLVKVYNDSGDNIIFWYKALDNDINPILIKGPVMALYLNCWNDTFRNPTCEWHEILYDNQVLLANVKRIRKIKL